MATYQGEKFLEEALESVAANLNDIRLHNIEISIQLLIVDDGSTDKTHSIIQEFSKKYRTQLEITYIKQENCGQAQSFENSLDYINGELILLLDSDDRFLPEKVRKVLEMLKLCPDCGMITHPQWVIDKNGHRTGKVQPRSARLSRGDVSQIAQKTARIIAPASSGLGFKTSLFKSIHPSPVSGLKPCTSPDLYLALAASLKAPICTITQPLSEYRKHENGKYFTRLSSYEGIAAQIEFQNRLKKHLNLKEPEKTNSFFSRMEFIHHKMTGKEIFFPAASQWFCLMRTTLKEKNFKIHHRVAFGAFWTLAFLAPKPISWKMWQKYLSIQSGL